MCVCVIFLSLLIKQVVVSIIMNFFQATSRPKTITTTAATDDDGDDDEKCLQCEEIPQATTDGQLYKLQEVPLDEQQPRLLWRRHNNHWRATVVLPVEGDDGGCRSCC